jgi:putative FmdB family regulatory protein
MPTYEYECKKCSHCFEVFQSMSDEPVKICPKCGNDVRRLIFGGVGVIFKGSGFYVTDKDKAPCSPPSQDAPAACASCPNNAAPKDAPSKEAPAGKAASA